ncbi:tripartite tricarboxylate transporter substrate binding protein [Xylophilus sp. Leaf220]|uniref:tripartite tricarboxylate transporter substrate binding protein n=1 Tax=Xylophilus sp. Leaf220 TaxID=1735686 RepID=UPI0006FEF837|nr:tripartite tricarboxylate transporter substrate binding protein [Xylophilus sp. Leaf220]KQM79427.1 LacI family transcriptional regulator [Xylophilus sp. Leaf220]
MKRFLMAALLAAAPFAASAQAAAHTVHVVVPFPPGGPVDVLGRVLAQDFGEATGQTFVVENKAGAAGNIGTDAVAKAAPDGATLGIIPAGNIAVNPSLFPALPYKASELAPVAMLATVENVLVVNPAVPARSVQELLALAAAKPESVSFASPGAGSQAHLAGELMALSGKVRMLHVPYKGIGPALNDLMGGQVTMMFGQMSSVLPLIRSGKLRAVGVASAQRSALLPDVPTVAEQGLPKFEAVSWYALMVPAATPAATVERLHAASARMLAKPAIREKFAAMGMEPGKGTPQELAATIQSETVRWGEVIRARNIKAD